MKIAQINASLLHHPTFERRVLQVEKRPNHFERVDNKKIKPIPLFRPNFPNSQHLIQKLPKQGHKYFSKFQASGPQTLSILQALQILSCTKLIQKFEFDPYLCDFSYLKQLRKSYKRLRETKKVNLVIRRLDKQSETDRLVPFLSKISKMQHLRFEMPNASLIDDASLIRFNKDLGKCYSLKSLSVILANLAFIISPQAAVEVDRQFRRLIHLQKRTLLISLRAGTVKNFIDYEYKFKSRRSKLLELDLSHCLGRGWSMIGSERSAEMQKFLASVTPNVLLEKLRMQIIKISLYSEEIMTLVDSFGQLANLKVLNLEFLNCKFEELEAISLIYQISKLTQIQDLTIKLIQTPNISINCLMAYVSTILKMKNLTNFNLYFRRLIISSDEEYMLAMQLSNLHQIKFANYKGSIHIYKNQS